MKWVTLPARWERNTVQVGAWKRFLQEAIYHYLYKDPQELDAVVREYMHFYNEERPHRKLKMKTPLQFETEFFTNADK